MAELLTVGVMAAHTEEADTAARTEEVPMAAALTEAVMAESAGWAGRPADTAARTASAADSAAREDLAACPAGWAQWAGWAVDTATPLSEAIPRKRWLRPAQ